MLGRFYEPTRDLTIQQSHCLCNSQSKLTKSLFLIAIGISSTPSAFRRTLRLRESRRFLAFFDLTPRPKTVTLATALIARRCSTTPKPSHDTLPTVALLHIADAY